jgi:hypothetical protein
MVTGTVGEARATNDTYATTAQQDNRNDQDGSLASPVVAALEQVWQGIRARHP